MSFYVTLPSDGSQRYFPNNSVTRFSTKLSEPLTLTGAWEVGLAQICYPHTWLNITSGYSITYRRGDGEWVQITLPDGYYRNPQEMVAYFVGDVNWNSSIRMYYKTPNKKIVMYCKEKFEIIFSDKLSQLFRINLTNRELVKGKVDYYKYESEGPINIDNITSLYIYLDIIEPQIVGSIKAPLLRTIKAQGKHGDIIDRGFTRPHFVPLIRQNIDILQVDIRSQLGDPIPFETGTSMLKLHFRRKNLL